MNLDYCSIRNINPDKTTYDHGFSQQFIANYTPHSNTGDMKTFEEIANESIVPDKDGQAQGKNFLAVLKADVDNLGMIFSYGLSNTNNKQQHYFSISRMVALSRQLDLFFTARLQHIIRKQYSNTYTVYAGGDDLLLTGPWFEMLKAKASYAYGRDKKDELYQLLTFFTHHTKAVKDAKDFEAFVQYFEAVVAYHKFFAKKN